MNTNGKIRCLDRVADFFVNACVMNGFYVKCLHANEGFSFSRMGFF